MEKIKYMVEEEEKIKAYVSSRWDDPTFKIEGIQFESWLDRRLAKLWKEEGYTLQKRQPKKMEINLRTGKTIIHKYWD